MEILVCIKQVPDDTVEIRLQPETMTPDLSQAQPQGNAFDTYALEMAVRFVEANGGSVTVTSVGPEDNKICLKNALAVGAAKAYLVSDEGVPNADAAVTANLLAAAIPQMEEANGAKFDLILCGRESTDTIGCEVGQLLAEKLGLPCVTNVVKVAEKGGSLELKKELDSGYLLVETSKPAVLTASKPDYVPRYPTIKSKLAARKMDIPVITPALTASDGAPKVSYLAYQEPPKREAGVKIEEEDAAEAVKRAMALMLADKAI